MDLLGRDGWSTSLIDGEGVDGIFDDGRSGVRAGQRSPLLPHAEHILAPLRLVNQGEDGLLH